MLPAVALLAEGVDRNKLTGHGRIDFARSPSSRRAWIEIPTTLSRTASAARSPSSRRAWIEITVTPNGFCASCVALLAEGVDRNYYTR